jgi:hypothetical protein
LRFLGAAVFAWALTLGAAFFEAVDFEAGLLAAFLGVAITAV